MRQIDLNADLGELTDASLDAAIIPHISSVNIACGAHAGNADTMRTTIRLAKHHGVSIGVHPGYPDSENFGRNSMDIPIEELCSCVSEQIKLLVSIAEEEGTFVRHVKLHGALYNDLVDDYDRSLAICKVIGEIDPDLRFIGFSNSETLRAAEDAGLTAVHEVFADRAYTADGKLVSRSQLNAVIHDEATSLAQVKKMVCEPNLLLPADSVCVHGDNPSAVAFASALRTFFEGQGMVIQPAGEHKFSFAVLGDNSLLAQLPPRISKSTHRTIRALLLVIEGSAIDGIIELVPCYAELKIDFDPATISLAEVEENVRSLAENLNSINVPEPRLIEIPVVYGGEDLKQVAEHNGLTEEEVIRLHSDPTYLVYMLGFSPGFAYMGGLNPKLATPRLESPRISVPVGSVGIAGNQTGIYPVESPGGWNIIGHTALKLFDPIAGNPFLFEAGDEVRFVPEGRARSPSAPKTARRSVPTSGIKIIEPGMYTTVQDAGRFGYLRYGLPASGAMDREAFAAANFLLGNDPNAAVLECTGTLPVLEFSESVKVAVVYANRFQTLAVSAGEPVKFQPLEKGYRAYIAIEGGIDVPLVMGSRSTYVPGKLGGLEGRTLRAGDVLPLRDHGSRLHVAEVPDLAPKVEGCIRVIPGPEADWFDCGGLNTFLSTPFSVSSKSDRTGIRLEGAPLSFRHDEQMVSSGISMGTIQVPPSGQPIIMMADHPTTGGYPRIGNVVEEDLCILAQMKPGDLLRFREIS
ncbi:MAG: 5-oxoprolinase subunit PxpB [Pontiella sp.]